MPILNQSATFAGPFVGFGIVCKYTPPCRLDIISDLELAYKMGGCRG
jgi:hypothetical protein